MKEVEQLKKEKNQDLQAIFKIGEKNRPLTAFLKSKTGCQQLEDYPQELDYYLSSNEEKEAKLETEKEEIKKEIGKFEGEKLVKKLRRKSDLESRVSELKKEKQRSAFPKYFSYITNNERL